MSNSAETSLRGIFSGDNSVWKKKKNYVRQSSGEAATSADWPMMNKRREFTRTRWTLHR